MRLKHSITANCKNMEWFKSHSKFLKPTKNSILNTKSPYMFEYGHSIMPATILLRKEAHLNTPKWKTHLPCYLTRERDLPLTIPLYVSFSIYSGDCMTSFSFLLISATSLASVIHCNTFYLPGLRLEPNSRWAQRNNCKLHRPTARVGRERKTNLTRTAVVGDQASVMATVWTVWGQSSRFVVATVTAQPAAASFRVRALIWLMCIINYYLVTTGFC